MASADLGAKGGGGACAMWQYNIQAGHMLGPCTLCNNTWLDEVSKTDCETCDASQQTMQSQTTPAARFG